MGALFFCLAVLGVILPILPTTPFLLLASYFFVRSSKKLNEAMLRSKWFGPLLFDWQVRGGIKQSTKTRAIVVVVIAVALTIYLSGYNLVPTLIVVTLVTIGLYVIYRVPTVEDSDIQ